MTHVSPALTKFSLVGRDISQAAKTVLIRLSRTYSDYSRICGKGLQRGIYNIVLAPEWTAGLRGVGGWDWFGAQRSRWEVNPGAAGGSEFRLWSWLVCAGIPPDSTTLQPG